MRRTVLVPAMVAAASRTRASLVAISLAALLVLAWALAPPAAAQEETTALATEETTAASEGKEASRKQEQAVQAGGQQAAARATESLQGAEARIIEDQSDDDDELVDRIEIDAAGCEVEEKGAAVTVDDEDGEPETFTNAPDTSVTNADEVEATVELVRDQVVIEVPDDANLDSGFGAKDTEETGTVSAVTGITCGRDAGEGTEDADNENDANDTDDLQNLSCAELLVLFRSEGQYDDASGFADSDVRAQVEVCLEEEILQGTAADEELPDTGGLSLTALAVLGVVSAGAGLAVIRGGRR